MPSIPTGGPLSDAAIAESGSDAESSSERSTSASQQSGKVQRSDAEWRSLLTPEQFHVLREKGTERAFSGWLYNNHADGLYHCGGCNAPLFKSDAKFESGSGWPSFFEPVAQDAVQLHEDRTYGMRRVEVLCGKCGSHLGHVFPDGPNPTGQRFCINSASLGFRPDGSNVGEN